MKLLAFIVIFGTVSCNDNNFLEIKNPQKIIIQKVDFNGMVWSSLDSIDERARLISIINEIGTARSYQKDKFTKYPSVEYIIILNDTIKFQFLSNKVNFYYKNKLYKLDKEFSELVKY